MGCNSSKLPLQILAPVGGPQTQGQPEKATAGQKLRIIHFNDCYNIQENPKKQYKGGAARFATAVRHYQDKAKNDGLDCLTVFSGDLLSPSLISTIFEGEQMVTSYNKCNVDVACIGNHDLDFGITQMDKVLKQTMAPNGSCQWIMTNLTQEDRPSDGAQGVGCCMRKAVVSKGGRKIGFIGVAEREWIDLFKNLEVDIVYQNYKRTASEFAKKLREEDGCDYIIALTHMRLNHDKKFATEIQGVDIVLGGHDHEYHCIQVDHVLKDQSQGPGVENKIVPLVKSGTDFRDFTEIDITFNVTDAEFRTFQTDFASHNEEQKEFQSVLMYSPADNTQFIMNRIRLQDGNWDPEPDSYEVEKGYAQQFKEQMGHTIGYVGIDLETRDSIIRRQETNFGNMIADLMRTEYSTDFAFVNSGSFRKNGVIEAGEVSLMMIQESFPFNDNTIVLKMKGAIFKEALEHAVSKYPAEEGTFPQVSNLQFTFDPEQPARQRILPRDIVTLAGGNFDLNRFYTVAVSKFLADGGDGFSMFLNDQVQTLVDEENGLWIIDIVKQFFKRTRTDFEIVPRRELARQMRLKAFNVDVEDELDGCSPDGRFYRVNPRFEGRILVLGQDIPTELQRNMTHLNMD